MMDRTTCSMCGQPMFPTDLFARQNEALWKKIEAALHKAWSAQSDGQTHYYNKAAWSELQQELRSIKAQGE